MLDNDLASIFGGLTITTATGGTEGGTLSLTADQSIRYTPLPNFQEPSVLFTVFKTLRAPSTPPRLLTPIDSDANADDLLDFTIEVLDPTQQSLEPRECFRGKSGKS